MDADQLIAIKAIRIDWEAGPGSAQGGGHLGAEPGWQVTHLGQIRVAVLPWAYSRWMQERIFEQQRTVRLCTGDPSEIVAAPGLESAANAAVFVIDPVNRTVRVSVSLWGLPPVFLWRSTARVMVTSPFPPTLETGVSAPDIHGIAEALRWGYPVGGRTLLAGVRFLPAEALLVLKDAGECIETSQPSRAPISDRPLSQNEIIDRQVAALARAGRRIPTENTFVSLSGGLDSRTALIAAMQDGRLAECASLAPSSGSVDARLARRVCAAHGIKHEIVAFDAAFEARLPELVPEAARLTRGVAPLSQAVDLHFYNCVGRDRVGRISGNLGNQVGRGGVEAISVAHPDTSILSPELRAAVDALPVDEPWFLPRMREKGFAAALLREEALFAFAPNYMVGSSRMIQLTPYADRELFDLAPLAYAHDPALREPTVAILRSRDIRHRFFGTPRSRSFQREFLTRYDKAGRNVPINWGWRARGGIDPLWFATSTLTAGDMVLDKLATRLPVGRKVARGLSELIGHPSANVSWSRMFNGSLRPLVADVLMSQTVLESGLVDRKKFTEALDDHMASRRDSFGTLSRLLEFALGLWPK